MKIKKLVPSEKFELVKALLKDISDFEKTAPRNYDGIVTPKTADILKKVYPKLYEEQKFE